MMREEVLILGAGNAQIPLMNYAHNVGYRVIAVSPRGNYAGISVADEVISCDVSDVERILHCVGGRNIAAVASEELDIAVPGVAYLAERLKLRGISVPVAQKFKNKYEMRKAAKALGVNVPGFVHADSPKRLVEVAGRLTYPLMIKPVDNASSKGVKKVYNIEQLKSAFLESASFSKNGVIIEEFIEGSEYIVEAFTHDGSTTNLIVGNSEYFSLKDSFVPRARFFRDAPSAISPLETRLKEINKRIVEGFGLRFGVTHGEYMYNSRTDKVYLIEIAARGGGVNIASKIIPQITGLHVGEMVMAEALGREVGTIKLQSGAAGYITLLLPEGVVSAVEGLDLVKSRKDVFYCNLDNIKIGDRTFQPTDKRSRKGPILVRGRDKDDCRRIADEIRQQFHVRISSQAGLSSEIWL